MLVIKLLDKVLVQNIGGRFPTVLTMRKSQPFNKKLMFTVFYSLLKQLLNLINITVRIWGFIRGERYVSFWSVITWTAYRLLLQSSSQWLHWQGPGVYAGRNLWALLGDFQAAVRRW